MTDLERLGGLLFGRPMRLIVANYIRMKGTGLVYQSEIAEKTGIKPSYVQQELDRFAQLGMISELPKADSPRRYFQRLESPLWEIIRIAADTSLLLSSSDPE